MDATARHGGDWQEELYQKLKYLKDNYLTDLREIYQKLSLKLSQLDSIVPSNVGGERIEKMKHFKTVLEHIMAILSLGKHNIQIGLTDKLPLYEKQILSILQNHKKAPQQQPQAGASSGQSLLHPLQQLQTGMQSQQLSQQQQPQQIHNHPHQLQPQSNAGAMIQSNSLSMPNAIQQANQNKLQSDQLLTNVKKSRKCEICGDCAHKRRISE